MRVPTILTVLLLSGLALAPARAQEHPNVAKGFNATATFSSSDVDNVNLFNGNLVIKIPLGQSFQVSNALAYQMGVTYNGQLWERQVYEPYTQAIPDRVANAGLGWMLSMGRLNPPEFLGPLDTYRDTYMGPDGSRHAFYPTLHDGETAVAGIQYSRDASYLRYNSSTREVEFPDGTVHKFDASGFPVQMRDRFNNQVNICYATSCGAVTDSWRITDTLGRVHWVYFKNTFVAPYQTKVIDRVDLAAFGGARAVYTFHYSTDDGILTTLTGCNNSDPQTTNISVTLLTSITLPSGMLYSMAASDYYGNAPSDGTNPCRTGLIKKMSLPTLGKVAWDYMKYQYPTESTSRGFWQNTAGVATRTLSDAADALVGSWTYSTVLSAAPYPGGPRTQLTNSVVDPLGNKVTRYFSTCGTTCTPIDRAYEYGLPLSREQVGDGAGRFLSAQTFNSSGTLLRSNYVLYEKDLPPAGTTFQDRQRLNQRQASQRTVFNDDGGLVADDSWSDFDGLGHYRGHTTGGTFPGENVKTSYTGFNPGQGNYGAAGYSMWATANPWILDTYTFSWDAEGGQLLFRSFCFDAATGFLRGRRVHGANDASYLANDVVEILAPDGAGNVATESYFGGDTQGISTDPSQGFICSLAATLTNPLYQLTHTYAGGVRATSSYSVGGTTLKILDQTNDVSTGLASSSRDTAGAQTAYVYDTSGRIFSEQPPGGAVSTYGYRNATTPGSLARVTLTQDVGGVTVTQRRATYDALGRLTLEEEKMPDGSFSSRQTLWNALGWRTFVSASGAVGFGTSFLNYDTFGRPGTIRPGDGSAHDVVLTYSGTRQLSRRSKVATSAGAESSATTTEIYDRHGRLYEVWEPNGVVTRHEYDAADHLKRVCQNASGATCGQQRLFTYDNRGYLLWETNPEKTANSYGLGHDVDYPSYDPRGHALRKIDGANDFSFVYDKAERVTLIRESGSGFVDCVTNGGHRCLKSFTFGNANGTTGAGATDWRKGKVVAASRFNYVSAPFNATVEIKEAYEYGGRGGRVSQKDTSNIFNAVLKETFRQSSTWDELGNLASQAYPDCTAPSLCGSPAPRTVGYGYTQGRLTSVSGFVNNITYHANGLVNRVAHANGVSDYQSADPNWLVRPAAIYALRDSDGFSLWNTGAYQYDGTGNVWKMGNAVFTYDLLSRVTNGTVYTGRYSDGAASSQSYTYDSYGNITGLTTAGSLLNTPAAAATNRLTGGTYDAAGNLTSWNGNSYEFDAFNQMTRMVSGAGAEDWRYIYTAGDERFWSYRTAGNGSVWVLRDLNGEVLREYQAHAGWGSYRDSIYREDVLVAEANSAAAGGGVYHLHVDHLGTPRLITDATGGPATATYHAYYPFGQELAGTFNTAYLDRQRFTGHERDLANPAGQGDDLDYMHARFCSPITGRFLSVDPTQESATPVVPQSWNRYAYGLNNPLKFTDPEGEVVNLAAAGIGALIGGGAGAIGSIAAQLFDNGGSWQKLSWQDVGASAAGGALSGGLAGLTMGGSLVVEGVGGAMVVGATTNMAGGMLTRALDSNPNSHAVDGMGMAMDAGWGAAGGAAGHGAEKMASKPLQNAERQVAASRAGAQRGNFGAAQSVRGNTAKAQSVRTTAMVVSNLVGAKTTNVVAPVVQTVVKKTTKKQPTLVK